MSVAEAVTIVVTVGIFLYLVALQTITLTLIVIGGWTVRDYLRRRPMRDFRDVARSSLSMAVTLMVPAYNEAATIRGSVSALFSNEYATFEVIVVNDGSSDDTLAALIDHFDLVPFQRAPRAGLVTQPVLATYVSRTQPRLFVVDKENGGKADSLNAALNYARYPLVCALDADTLLDPQALARIVWEFEAHPETIAVGGIVRVANGSVFDGTRITRVRTPTGLLPNLQIMEYLRAFLGARIGWSRLNMLIIISGAFGVFR
ncbi:MAG TPA: glycosyltransferase family 2 protein, partial [Actinomycetota bacterium]|nr:glycosyltransferase family 2 protein [Actinomycetota bacterium]